MSFFKTYHLVLAGMVNNALPLLLLSIALPIRAQLLTVSPSFPQDNTALTITVDCNKGNKGLLNYGIPTDVYVHVGVITNLSSGPSAWKYVKFSWGTTDPAARATSIGNNKYQYVINNIRSFFGVPASETIQKVAILFRNGAGTVVQRNSDGSDMYLPVYGAALAGRFILPPQEPRYNPIPEPVNVSLGSKVYITWGTSTPADLKLFFNGAQLNAVSAQQEINDSVVITVSGNQQLVAWGTFGSTKLEDTLNFFVPPAVQVQDLPAGIRDGITYEPGDTTALLVLYAPGKERVSVLGDFNNWTENSKDQCYRTTDGKRYWIRISGLSPGIEYAFQYLVDGSLRIGDPYCEKVLDAANDRDIGPALYPDLKAYPTGKTTGIVSVLQTAKPKYTWKLPAFNRPDKRSLVIYELLMRDFSYNHDWKTVMDTLPYLRQLGINAIELMPFNEFEGNSSWGYNPSYYLAPDKYYGTERALKEFIDACHQQGIAVIMDIALNHSFGQSPLVQLYFDASNNRPAAANPWFNPVAKHPYNVGYDMNHESPATQMFFSRVVEYWLSEYKLDGFRFDLSKGFTQVASCDANGGNCNVSQWGNNDPTRIAIWKKYYDTLQLKSPGSYVILEHFADNQEEKTLSDYGMLLWGNLNYNFNEATMGYVGNSNFSGALHTVRGWSQPHLISYMESHDEERLMYKNLNFGSSSSSYNIRNLVLGLRRNEMAASFLFLMPGPKMIWQFGELGYDFSINTCKDGSVNSNCRLADKPVRWDYLLDENRKRLYRVYRSLLTLRAHPWYREGMLSDKVQHNLTGAFKWLKLTTDTSNIVVIGNFDVAPATATVTFPGTGTWYDYLTGTVYEVGTATKDITLQPGEYHVYVNRNYTFPAYPVTPVAEIPYNGRKIRLSVYPNPLVSSGVIEYEIPESGPVSLKWVNGYGQVVAVWTPGYKPAGVYRVDLAQAGLPKIVPSGPCFLQLEFKQRKLVQKLVFGN